MVGMFYDLWICVRKKSVFFNTDAFFKNIFPLYSVEMYMEIHKYKGLIVLLPKKSR